MDYYNEEKMFTKGVVMNNRMVEMVKFLAKKDLTSFSHIARKAMLYGITQMMEEKNLKEEFEKLLEKKQKILQRSEDLLIKEEEKIAQINNSFNKFKNSKIHTVSIDKK